MATEASSKLPLVSALVIDEDALGAAVEILILAAAQRPQESDEPSPTEEKRHRNENEKIAHYAGFPNNQAGATCGSFLATERPPANRMALAMTMIDDSDMAIAAIRGVA